MLDALPLGVSLRAAHARELRRIADIDDDAGTLYAEAGIFVDLPIDSPYVEAEARRWRASLAAGRVWLAVDSRDQPLAFVSCGFVDGAPYVEQLSVRRAHMRRGLGRALLGRAIAFASGQSLWLTTYAHLPWNGPYYERAGFVMVPPPEHGPELRATLELERASLPAPDQRIAMKRDAAPHR
jgi:GNAT superfamily N-acetyltransferase